MDISPRTLRLVWAGVAVMLVLVLGAATITIVRGRMIVPPMPTPTATSTVTPALALVPSREPSSEAQLIAERMTAQPIREDCLYRKPEMMDPSRELAQGPESDLVVSVTWHEDVTGRPYCGGAAVWRFDSEKKAEEKLRVQTAKLGDLEAGTCLSDACGKAMVVRAGRWVVWVLVAGDTVEQAEEHLTEWLTGFLKDLAYLFG